VTLPDFDKNPMKPEEDQMVRRLASDGFSAAMISDEMKKVGFRRGANGLRLYMWKYSIRVDRAAAIAMQSIRMKETNGKGGAIADSYISPFEANALFAAAFQAGSGGRAYTDHRRASRGKDALTMVRPTASQQMTTAGVAVYG
jgi:hypothetical protein